MYTEINRRGNITIILLGLISIILVMVFAMSKRMSGHTQLLTLSDQTQITRYFLESYAGDILQQINASANKPGSDNFKIFRQAARNQKVDTKFYQPSTMLLELAEELKAELQLPPEIVFSQIDPLEYPPGFVCPNDLKGLEKKGLLEIVCRAKFYGRNYSLRVQYPFTVVMRLTPIIKDFVLFADRIAREQGREKIGPEDNLNVMYTKDGAHPDMIDNDALARMTQPHRRIKAGVQYRPLVLQPAWDASEFSNPKLSGRVFLGPSNESVFLNLAGDNREIADTSMGELFLISPETFKVARADTKFEHIGFFGDQSGGLKMMGMDIPLKHGHTAKLGILGFSHEVVPELGVIFKGSAYTPEDFFNSGSHGSEFYEKMTNYGTGYMALASGLKIFGIKPQGGVLPAREVYGNVLSRFFVLTFWWTPSAGGEPLKFDEARGDRDFPSRSVYGLPPYHFEPEQSDLKYHDFMSRMVSGKDWRPSSAGPPDGFVPLNIDNKVADGRQSRKIYNFQDFVANDGFEAKAELEALGQQWFGVGNPSGSVTTLSGCERRVGRIFEGAQAFLKATNIDKGEFNVNGVVYVYLKDGERLEIPNLTMKNDRIGGGMVLVDGPLVLNNITRGYNIDNDSLNIGEVGNQYAKWRTEINQENFLTFVSLKGDSIMLRGETLLGVHLINLNDRFGQPYDQIQWSSSVKKEILFCGGIACNYLNLPERLKEFGTIKSACNILNAPFFLYHSAMASDKPAFAVQILENMRGYRLTAGKSDDE